MRIQRIFLQSHVFLQKPPHTREGHRAAKLIFNNIPLMYNMNSKIIQIQEQTFQNPNFNPREWNWKCHTENLRNRRDWEKKICVLCFVSEVGYAGSHSCKNLELHISCIGVVRVNLKGILVPRRRPLHWRNRRFAGHFSLPSVVGSKQKCSRCVKNLKSRRVK